MSLSSSFPRPANESDSQAAERLVLRVGHALHSFGMPSHRLETALVDLAGSLGIRAQFFSTPTALFASFGHHDEPRTRMLRVDPGDAALEKLTRLQRILDRVRLGTLGPRSAARAVAAVVEAPMRFGPLSLAFSTALVAGPAAVFFGGGWREVGAASVAGLIVGLLGWLGTRSSAVDRVFYPLAGATAALIVSALAAWTGSLATGIAAIAGLIVLVPGMTLTRAMSELAARHLVSGAARMAGALLVFLTLGFGVAVGGAVATALFGPAAPVTPVAFPAWATWPALLVAALALVVQFQAHPRQAGWVLLAGVFAIFGVQVGSSLLGPELGAFIGALLVGLAGNAVARWRRMPASLLQMPGLILLVPGSVGLRSVNALVAHDTLAGIQTAFTVGMVAISLVTGLLVANVLLPSRRAV